jgi:hypothetical protein
MFQFNDCTIYTQSPINIYDLLESWMKYKETKKEDMLGNEMKGCTLEWRHTQYLYEYWELLLLNWNDDLEREWKYLNLFLLRFHRIASISVLRLVARNRL